MVMKKVQENCKKKKKKTVLLPWMYNYISYIESLALTVFFNMETWNIRSYLQHIIQAND